MIYVAKYLLLLSLIHVFNMFFMYFKINARRMLLELDITITYSRLFANKLSKAS